MHTEVRFSKPYYFNDGLRLDIAYSKSAKNLWVKKATGLGITEFMLRMMAWLCTRNSGIVKSQMCKKKRKTLTDDLLIKELSKG